MRGMEPQRTTGPGISAGTPRTEVELYESTLVSMLAVAGWFMMIAPAPESLGTDAKRR